MAKKKANVPAEGHVSGQSNRPMSLPAHALSSKQVEEELGGNVLNGLAPEEAARRLEEFGKNDLGDAEGVQPLRIVIAQIANAMTMVSFCPRGRLVRGRERGESVSGTRKKMVLRGPDEKKHEDTAEQ